MTWLIVWAILFVLVCLTAPAGDGPNDPSPFDGFD